MADIPLSPGSTGTTRGRLLPPPALCAFLLLLVLLFSVSYAVGSAAGPVAPGMHGGGGPGHGGGGGGGMDDMPGMSHGSGG
ncbi:hypothetical protein [Streptomyces malaysiense]|uniref:Uncharacterized protein n=1 Tax=Streptomyces malaysiense TaxID=1428626 RepID=A0A1J4Q7N4_9ACTN|nr:hypothetical protein [Streptomyces malaysiense]OIK28374.1 hypothetical protein VT52_006900 [Streptomyces malaysiense]